MKKYRAIELVLVSNGVVPPEQTDFGKKAAVSHRIMKGSWEGQRTKKEGFKSMLGRGGFKQVFEVPAASGVPATVDFVLAKLNVEQDTDDKTKRRIYGTMFELIATMYVYGIPRMTTWIAYSGREIDLGGSILPERRMVMYLPRVSGSELKKLIKQDASLIDLNQRIRWFNQACAQVREIHEGRLFLGDIKPENIMADDIKGATVIDLGGVNRPWRLASAKTRTHELGCDSPEMLSWFETQWRESMGAAIPTPVRMCYLSVVQDAKRAQAAINALPAHEKKEYKRSVHDGINRGLWGVYHDTYSLAVTALQLKLVDSGNAADFARLIQHKFRPYDLQIFLQGLRSRYTGDPAVLDRPSPFHVLPQITDFRVHRSYDSTLDPEPLIHSMATQHLRELDDAIARGTLTQAQRDERAEALAVFEVAMKFFRAFSSLSSVYQIEGGKGGKKTVDTKHQTMTGLINLLTWTTEAGQLRDTLTRIFAASLVNRSVFSKEITTSFNTMYKEIRSTALLLDTQRYWSPRFNSGTSVNDFRSRVIEMASLIDTDVASDGAFKKSHQNERLLRMVDSAAAGAPAAPASKEEIVAAIDACLASARNRVHGGPLNVIEQLRLAGQANPKANLESSENTLTDECASEAGVLAQRAYESLLGNESAASIANYTNDLLEIYTTPA